MKLSLRLGVVLCLLFGLGYPVGALAVQAMSPGLVLLVRFALSAVILAVIATCTGARWPRGRMLAHVAVVGLLIQAVQFVGAYTAFDLDASPVLVALVIAMNPLATALVAAAVLGERISRRRAAALVLAVVAVVTALGDRFATVGGLDIAVLAVLVALLGLAGGSVYQQRFVRGVDPIAASAVGMAVSVLPAGAYVAVRPMHVHDAAHAVLWMAVMVIFSSVICMTLYVVAVRRAGAGQVSMIFAVIPSVSALLSWVLLGTRPGIGVIVGLVVGAVACLLGRPGPLGGAAVATRRISVPVVPAPAPRAPARPGPASRTRR